MTAKKITRATHEGKLKLGGAEIDVAVLENGQRIITQNGVFKALDRPSRGNSRVIGIPVFIDAKNLQPFIDEELKGVIKKVEYIGTDDQMQQGFDANILPLVCDLYLKAREAGVIVTANQMETAKKAEILVRALAKVAITSLIDEATGYQYEREKDALQVIFKAYINEELLKWQKMFPDMFYFEIFRLNGWSYTVGGINKRPGVIGTWTNELIYKQLPKGVLEELKKVTPKSDEGNYTARFFQSLTPNVGHPALSAQIYKVIGIMNISSNWDEFKTLFNRMVDRNNGQMEIDFDKVDPE
ncbi:P63C domain-containing protein [Chryseobacterium sp.]|uniref:P63C domain-containing protein n=1 Tax=Chryseobacterium sp. TaxID=1871047 RepID=UPI0024E1CF73|nr:P63C domain-containing protein [Chryseobacterium sp.]